MKSIHILSQFGFDAESEQESIYPFSPVYKVGDCILKRTQSPIGKARRLIQYTAHLEAAGIPVVTPVNLSTENPQCIGDDCYVCYPFIEGAAYTGTDQEIIQAGRLLGQIHRLASPDNPFHLPVYDVFDFNDHEVEEHLTKIKELADCYEVNLDCARLETLLYQAVSRQKALKASPLKWVETPHDYKANNLVYQETPVLIDPDNAAWIPRIFDLALALLLFHNEHASAPHRVFTPKEWRLFLEGYLTYQSLTETEIETWHDAVLHVFLDDVMWLMAEVEEDWQRPEQRALFVSVTNVIAELDAYSLATSIGQTGRKMKTGGGGMGITEQSVAEVLEQFGLQGTVSSVHPFIDYHSEADQEVKFIAKVGFKDRAPLVVKFLKEPEHPPSVIESQSIFSEFLRNCGIRTAKRYEKNGTYCLPYQWNGLDLVVTIEEYLGEEIEAIDFPLTRKIGQLLGKIHTVSEEGGCRIGKETIFNFLGYNEVSGYDTFCEMSTIRELDPLLFGRIKGIYEEKREAVQLLWNSLPRAATQGDISINNLTVADGTIGIFDYNIAGDATLVGDMVLQGLLTANEMPLAEGILEESRPDLFRVFCEGYCSERALTKEERMAAEYMYSVSSAFWFTGIRYDDDSLEQLMDRGEDERAERKLQDIYNSLLQDCWEIFESGDSGEFNKRVKNT